jgi:hypothetical protein
MTEDTAVDELKSALNTGDQGYDRWELKDESTIDYGYLAKTGGTKIAEEKEGFYITTAINYTNGPAHMGHAYEAATTDVIARFERLKGDRPSYFVTGSDEHGQKIAGTAEQTGKAPQEICDQVSGDISILHLDIARLALTSSSVSCSFFHSSISSLQLDSSVSIKES